MIKEKNQNNKVKNGVFLIKGDSFGIEQISISINEQGIVDISSPSLNTGVDMTSWWLDIAYQNLKSTEISSNKLMHLKSSNNDSEIGKYLKKESKSGMQSIVASAITIDAYYESVKNQIELPSELISSWKKNRTARYKQIAETLRLAFKISNNNFKNISKIIQDITAWRDSAVHPSSQVSAPTEHIELSKIVDWRYAKFRFYNAKLIYGATLSLIYKTCASCPSDNSENLTKYCDNLMPKIKPSIRKWKRKYGAIL